MVIKIKLSKKYTKDGGKYPVVVSVSKDGKTVDIPTSVSCNEKDFVCDGKNGIYIKKNVENSYYYNNELNQLLLTYNQKIQQLGQSAISKMSVVDIKHYLLSEQIEAIGTPTFIEYARKQLPTYKGQSQKLMEHTINIVEEFFNGRPMFFDDITAGVLRQIDEHWQKTKSINTRGIYFRNIRAIFNRAIDDEITTNYPFRKFKIKSTPKKKHEFPIESLRKLANLEFSKTDNLKELARDVFMLSFFLCGANLKDIYNLTQDNYKKGKICFVRTKIKRFEPERVEITLQPEAKAILEKYKGSQHLFSFADKYQNYDTFINNIDKRIRLLRNDIDFEDLTLYYARYTWATIAFKQGVDEKIISKSLGHQDTTVAGKFYILYDWSLTDRANRKVIDYVFAK